LEFFFGGADDLAIPNGPERKAPQPVNHAVIHVYDDAGNVIETREHAGDFKSRNSDPSVPA
jgi:hypothetical protein